MLPRIALAFIAATIFASAGCFDKGTNRPASGGSAAPATVPPVVIGKVEPQEEPGPAIDVGNGSKMFDVFLNTPIKAEKEYVGKRVRILGNGRVYKDEQGWYVTLPTALGLGTDSEGYIARIDKGHEDAFAEVKAGQVIVIEATIRSWSRDRPDLYKGIAIEMDRARFIRFHKDK